MDEALLSTGGVARVVPLDDGWAIEIDGVRQSHVGEDAEPSPHASVRWMLAGLADPLERATAPRLAHLGGAAMSLPRQIAHRRPDALQTVVELEPALVDLVARLAPAPPGVATVVDDGRAWLEGVEAGSLDALAIDVYAGGRIPPAFTSVECAVAAGRALADDGVLVVNGVCGAEIDFTRRHLASTMAAFEHVAAIVRGSVLAGARFGNLAIVASASPLPLDAMRDRLRGDPSRGALVPDVAGIALDAAPLRDAEAIWSPVPTAEVRLPRADG